MPPKIASEVTGIVKSDPFHSVPHTETCGFQEGAGRCQSHDLEEAGGRNSDLRMEQVRQP
jgi:hypothetical protein